MMIKQKITIGQQVNARIIAIRRQPIAIECELQNGQKAIIGPCELVDNYTKIDSVIDELKKGNVCLIICCKMDEMRFVFRFINLLQFYSINRMVGGYYQIENRQLMIKVYRRQFEID